MTARRPIPSGATTPSSRSAWWRRSSPAGSLEHDPALDLQRGQAVRRFDPQGDRPRYHRPDLRDRDDAARRGARRDHADQLWIVHDDGRQDAGIAADVAVIYEHAHPL